MMPRAAILLAASLLAMTGCAGGVTSVPFPTPAQAAADAAAQQAALLATGLDPASLWENEDVANTAACDQWLIRQSMQSGAFGLAAQGAGLGSAASMGLLAATGAGPAAPIIAGIAGALVSSALATLSSTGAMPYSAATAAEIRTAMAAYAQAAPAPATMAEAALLGEGQLYLCTPPGATGLAGKAIETAQVTAAGSPSAAAFAPAFAAALPPLRFAPPVITVNGR